MIADSQLIPLDTRESIDAYVSEGLETGGFLRAVLENNLMEAMGRADAHNLEALPHICAYVYNEIPSACHGAPSIVRAWLERKAKEREVKTT